MILKDKCAELGISLKEGKELFGLTHWKQQVPERSDEIADAPEEETISLEDFIEEVVEVAEEVIEEIEEEDPVEQVETIKAVLKAVVEVICDEDKLKSVRGLGTKSPYWSELRG